MVSWFIRIILHMGNVHDAGTEQPTCNTITVRF